MECETGNSIFTSMASFSSGLGAGSEAAERPSTLVMHSSTLSLASEIWKRLVSWAVSTLSCWAKSFSSTWSMVTLAPNLRAPAISSFLDSTIEIWDT